MNLIRRLLAKLHRHKWEATAHNFWGIAAEQRCRCGQYRHHTWNGYIGLGEEPRWRPGRHPNSRLT